MKYSLSTVSTATLCLPLLLTGCKDGATGRNGADSANGNNGLSSLVRERELSSDGLACSKGGVMEESGMDDNRDGKLEDGEVESSRAICGAGSLNKELNFNRVATFPVCAQLGSSCDKDAITAAEIVASSSDGMTLIYSNSPAQQVGFIDIRDPVSPTGLGALALAGEPTSVAVAGPYALVGVNRSENYVQVAGSLEIIEIRTREIIHTVTADRTLHIVNDNDGIDGNNGETQLLNLGRLAD